MGRTKQLLNVRNVIALLIVLLALTYFLYPKLKSKLNGENDVRNLRSIAVLPFANVNNNPGQEYFSDGFTEDVLNDLSRIKSLKVCARTSSFQFRGKLADVRQIGEKLKVSMLLQGDLLIKGNQVEVTIKLIDAKDGGQILTGQYTENMDNVGALQNKITSAVAEKLQIQSTGKNSQVAARKPTPGKEAYSLYLKGRECWNLGTLPNLKKGINFFRQAIARDSSYAAAYSGIADCYTALGYSGFIAPRESFPKALEAATKALQLDSTLADPHASLGYYKFYYEWDWAAAEQEFRAALARNANYAMGYDWYGYYLTAMKRYDEAMIVLKKARELDPLSVRIATDIGFCFFYKGELDQAISACKGALQKNSKFMLAHLWLGRAYHVKKMYPEAISEYKKGMEAAPGWPIPLALIGNAYGETGDKQGAQRILDTLISWRSKKYVLAYGVATVYVGMGEKEQTFLWLNKAIEERSNWLVWLKSDPRWAPIYSDKRYAEMVSKIALP